jgi:hypothetical protein
MMTLLTWFCGFWCGGSALILGAYFAVARRDGIDEDFPPAAAVLFAVIWPMVLIAVIAS